MNDDWRLRIDLHDEGFAHRLAESLQASELEHDLQRSFRDRVIVSVDGSEVFLYAADRDQAQAAEAVVRRIATEQGWSVDSELTHWHPTAERWEDPDAPLPADEAAAAAERAQRAAAEREESAAQGYPEFEVRVRCASRHEAGELSERLEREGIANVHRWSYVLVGAADEPGAQALAQRLRGELPASAQIAVETNPRAIWDNLPSNPFAVLGGLAG